jgi:hypothetical protein
MDPLLKKNDRMPIKIQLKIIFVKIVQKHINQEMDYGHIKKLVC